MNLTYLCYGESNIYFKCIGRVIFRRNAVLLDEIPLLIGAFLLSFVEINKGLVYHPISSVRRIVSGKIPVPQVLRASVV